MKTKTSCFNSSINDAVKLLPGPEGQRFATVFQHGSLMVEIYAPRDVDPQQPHTRDEVYVVASGNGEFVCGEHRTKFREGDLLFVGAGITHRFENFSNDLTVWVLFYGPEGGVSQEIS